MRKPALLAVATVFLTTTPALAQTAADPDNVRAEDIALSPLSDVNLRKKDIPVVLEAAIAAPYDLTGIKTCKGFATAIESLDTALGDDIDVARLKSDEEKMGNSAGRIAKSVIGSFIPFRSIVREVSGANAQEREWDRALYAGSVRRAFLKGVGQTKGCAYPARSATPQIAAMIAAKREQAKAENTNEAKAERTAGAPVTSYTSQEVVQPTAAPRR